MIHKDNNFYDVVGIGNAIVDVMAKVGEGFLTERELPKGGMTLVNAPDAGKIYAEIISPVVLKFSTNCSKFTSPETTFSGIDTSEFEE